jgi:predicted Zn-dependent protease
LIDALVAEESRNPRALIAQAELRLAGRRLPEALESITAAEATGTTGRILLMKGEVLAALTRTDEAIPALTEAARLDIVTGQPQLVLHRYTSRAVTPRTPHGSRRTPRCGSPGTP